MASVKSKIKVLFTIPNFDTAGSGKALMKVALRLNPDIYESHIGCLHTRGAYFENVVAKSGLTVHEFPFVSVGKSYFDLLRKAYKVSLYLKKNKFDIIHSYHYGSDYSEALAAKIAGIPWVYTKKNMNWGGKSANSWMLRTKLAKKVVFQNKDMKKMFFPKLSKTFFIPRGVDDSEFFPHPINAELKQELNIPAENKIVLTVANIVPVKGIEYLIQGFDKVYKNNKNITLLIVGDKNNDYAKKMIELANSVQSSNNIIFAGKRFNVSDFLSIADVFVLSTVSKGEGSPVALLEAMASGVLSIGSEIPGVRDQLEKFPELMFKPMDSEDLANKLEYILNLGDKANEFKDKLLQNVRNNYLLSNEIQAHEKLYNTIKPL